MAMTLRTDDELDSALSMLADREGISKQEVIRRAVLDRAARHGHLARVAELDSQLDERWGGLLDRLGTV
jgi:predicted transcriptional regulator